MSSNVYILNFLKGLKPDPKISISEWAERERILAPSGAAEAGKYRLSRVPYCREVLDTMSPFSPVVEEYIMKGTQLGFSEVANNIAMYYMQHVPTAVMLLMMTKDVALSHTKNKITPAIKAMPKLLSLITDAKQKDDAGGTLLKEFPGGYFRVVWAQSTASYANASIRVLLIDDTDRFPDEIGEEGDPIKLAIKRTNSYGRKRKIFNNSTPTTKSKSKIYKGYLKGDQRHYYMPCPHCTPREKEKQNIKNMVRFEFVHFHFEYDKDYRLKSDVAFVCPHCGSLIEEKHKSWMMDEQNGAKWIATAKPINQGIVSRRLPSYYSPVGWLSWNDIFQDFLEAKQLMNHGNSSEMKTWKNTLDANVWEEDYTSIRIKNHELMERREKYSKIPEEVFLLVAGVDTQDDRYEIEVLGIGKAGETWSIETHVIRSDPNLKDTEQLLDEYLSKSFTCENGNIMKIYAVAIDTGGHRTLAVSRFCKARYSRRIYAIKGAKPIDAPAVNKKPSLNKYETRFFQVGVNSIKDDFYAKLTLPNHGAGYCHFPYREASPQDELYDAEGYGLYDAAYFDQLTVEVQDENGRWVNPLKKRNEATDIRVYALAAYELCPRDVEKMDTPLFNVSNTPKKIRRRRRTIKTGVKI